MRYARQLAVVATLVALSLPGPLSGQIRLGRAEVALGQSKETVLTAIRRTGTRLLQLKGDLSDAWSVGDGPGGGLIQFSEGILTSVSRAWTPSDESNGFEVARAVVGALTSLAGSGTEPCFLSPGGGTAPGSSSWVIRIECPGGRSASVAAVDSDGYGKKINVSESWRLTDFSP